MWVLPIAIFVLTLLKLFYFEIITESQEVTKITYWKLLKPKNTQAHLWLALSDDVITDDVVCGKHHCPTRGRLRMKMAKNILVLLWKHFWYYVLIDTIFENTYFEPLREGVSGTCRPHIENCCASKWNTKCQDMYFFHTELVLCLKRAEEVPQRGCPRSKSLLGFGDWPNYYRKPNSSARSWGVYVCGKHPGYINHNFIIC